MYKVKGISQVFTRLLCKIHTGVLFILIIFRGRAFNFFQNDLGLRNSPQTYYILFTVYTILLFNKMLL